MGTLLHRATDEVALLLGRRCQSDLEDGVPSPQLLDYEQGVLGKLHDLVNALRAGTWQPHPVFAREIPKSAGRSRLIAVPHVEDRVVERAVLGVLDDVIDPLLLPW